MSATTDFGRSLSCVSDLTPEFSVVTGRRLLGEAIARRISTPRGGLIDDPNYGIDVPSLLLDSMTPAQIARIPALVDAELQKDERVIASTTTASFVSGVLTLNVSVSDGDGPFSLTIAVSQVTVKLLKVSP